MVTNRVFAVIILVVITSYSIHYTKLYEVEIGGTIGDIEGLPFVEAIRQLGNELGRDRSLFVHVTLVPYLV